MTTLQNATAIHSSMPHWAHILKAGALTYNGDDLRSMAMQAIRTVDHELAPTSETAYLGQALHDLTERSAPTDQDIFRALTYWDTAYAALDQQEQRAVEMSAEYRDYWRKESRGD